DGALLAVGTYERVHLFEVDGGPGRVTSEPKGYVRGLVFGGPGGSLLAAIDDHGHAHVIRVADLARIATVRGPENWTEAVAFAGDDHLLVGDYDGHLLLWDIARAAASGFAPRGYDSKDHKPQPPRALVRRFADFKIAG